MVKSIISEEWRAHLKKIAKKGNKKRWEGKTATDKAKFMENVRKNRWKKD